MFTPGDLDSNILLPGFFVDDVEAPLLLGSFAQIKRRNLFSPNFQVSLPPQLSGFVPVDPPTKYSPGSRDSSGSIQRGDVMGGGVRTVRETWSGKASPNAKRIILGVDSYYDLTLEYISRYRVAHSDGFRSINEGLGFGWYLLSARVLGSSISR